MNPKVNFYKIMLQLILVSIFIAGCEELSETDLSSRKVTLIAPADNIATTSTTNTFAWDPVDDASRYQIQIVSPKFDSIIHFITDSTITRTNFIYTLQQGIYQWRVRALNTGSQTSYSVHTLTIQ